MTELIGYSTFQRWLTKIGADEGTHKAYSMASYVPEDVDALAIDLNLLNKAKVFKIETALADLLLETDNIIEKEKLPYPTSFLDAQVELSLEKEWTLHGLVLSSYPEIMTLGFALLSRRMGPIPRIKNPFEWQLLWIDIFGDSTTDNFCFIGDEKEIAYSIPPGQDDIERQDENLKSEGAEKIRLLAVNFLDFLHNPEVEWKKSEGKASHPNQPYVICPYCGRKLADSTALNRHIKRSHPNKIPETRECVLKGKTKRYVQNYRKLGKSERRKVRRHWVRGHYRKLRSDYFTRKQGQKVWIPPHTRGEGILVPKKYRLKQ